MYNFISQTKIFTNFPSVNSDPYTKLINTDLNPLYNLVMDSDPTKQSKSKRNRIWQEAKIPSRSSSGRLLFTLKTTVYFYIHILEIKIPLGLRSHIIQRQSQAAVRILQNEESKKKQVGKNDILALLPAVEQVATTILCLLACVKSKLSIITQNLI